MTFEKNSLFKFITMSLLRNIHSPQFFYQTNLINLTELNEQ